MKKGFLKLSVLFVALFMGIAYVNAAESSYSIVDGTCVLSDASTSTKSVCYLKLKVSETAKIETGKEFKIIVQNPTNIKENQVKLVAEDGWTIDGETTKTVTLGTEGVTVIAKYTGTDAITNTTITIAAGEYEKEVAAQGCGFNYGLMANACEVQTSNNVNYYFGKDGNLLGTDDAAKDQFYKDCFACTTPDKSPDKKYHGLDGKETTDVEYKKQCTNTCKYDKENNKYYCKDANECTKEEYDNECATNEKQGSFLPYAGIIAGVVLIITATVMVKKQTTLRKL